MDLTNIKKLEEQLMIDEGVKYHPYKDSVGKLTIGIGRNLDDKGLSMLELLYLLDNDIKGVFEDLDRELPWWREKSNNRQRALANMCFNLGIGGLGTFKNMLAALILGDYKRAADEALDSKWAKQVGDRAIRIANLIRGG